MKIAGSGLEIAQQRRKVREPPGEQVDDLPVAFHLAEDGEKLRAEELAALAVADVAPDDHVGRAGFVFERDEDHAARGVGPLPADDDAGRADDAALRRLRDLGGGGEPPLVAARRAAAPADAAAA